MQGRLIQWTQDIVDVLAQPPGQPQIQALTAWLQCLAFTDHFALFIYEGGHPPLALFDTFPANIRHRIVSEYQVGPYQMDPFYLACVFGQADGLYSLQRLAPERFHASEYFRTYYRHLGLCGQLGFISSLGGQSRAVLSLVRRQGSGAFSDEEKRWLGSAMPVVDQVVRAAWEVHRKNAQPAADDMGRKVGEAFEQFGRGVLTERQCEVARLLLEGHSNVSMSQRLRITPGTVKVHRRNLYEKLEIGSQSELLALFVRELKRS